MKLDFFFAEVMASANCSSSSLGKRKVGNDSLAGIRVNSCCRSEREKKFEEEEELCVTPKSEEQKIPTMETCPPAPHKPKSAPLNRNPAIISSPTPIYFPSDSPDLDLLFGSDLTKDDQHQKKKKKQKKQKRKESSSSMRSEEKKN